MYLKSCSEKTRLEPDVNLHRYILAVYFKIDTLRVDKIDLRKMNNSQRRSLHIIRLDEDEKF
jgi:hypothetical protein